MGRNPDGGKKTMQRLLFEYLRDSNRSDRQVAKELGVSQPTVSRLKSKLIKEGFIDHFTVIPNFVKMGYEILAFSNAKFNRPTNVDDMSTINEIAQEWAKSHPEIVFTSLAEGMGMNAVTISLHKDYSSYNKFLKASKDRWEKLISEYHFILVDLKGPITKPFSFKYLADDQEK
jgi:DNA-binding Lrp family transcriptional regulator